MDSHNEGPAYQSMEEPIEQSKASEMCNYIGNMTKIFAFGGGVCGGCLCLIPADCCCTKTETVEGKPVPKTSAAGNCLKIAGWIPGTPVGMVTGATGCVIGTLTSPCVGFFGQPKPVKELGESIGKAVKKRCC